MKEHRQIVGHCEGSSYRRPPPWRKHWPPRKNIIGNPK